MKKEPRMLRRADLFAAIGPSLAAFWMDPFRAAGVVTCSARSPKRGWLFQAESPDPREGQPSSPPTNKIFRCSVYNFSDEARPVLILAAHMLSLLGHVWGKTIFDSIRKDTSNSTGSTSALFI